MNTTLAVNIATRGAGALLALAGNIAIARLLGLQEAGRIFWAISALQIAVGISKYGLDVWMVRKVSKCVAVGERGDIRQSIGEGVGQVLKASSLVYLCLCLSLLAGLEKIESTEVVLVLMAALFQSLVLVLCGVHKGLGRSLVANFMEVGGVSLLFLAVLGAGIIAGAGGAVSAVDVGRAYFSGSMLAAALMVGSLSRCGFNKIKIELRMSRKNKEEIMPIFTTTVAQLVMQWGVLGSLTLYCTEEEIAVYSAAFRTSMLISFAITACNAVIMPKIVRAVAMDDWANILVVCRQAGKNLISLVGPFAAILFLFPSEIMSMYGGQYSKGGSLLSIIAVSQVINLITGPVTILLMAIGKDKVIRFITMLNMLISIILSMVLGGLYGSTGVAIAVALALSLQHALPTLYLYNFKKVVIVPWMKL